MISIKQIRENLIKPALGRYYDRRIEPKIFEQMTPEQRVDFEKEPEEELKPSRFD